MSKGYINVWTSFQLFVIWTAAIPDLSLRPPAIITNYPLFFFPALTPIFNLAEKVLKGRVMVFLYKLSRSKTYPRRTFTWMMKKTCKKTLANRKQVRLFEITFAILFLFNRYENAVLYDDVWLWCYGKYEHNSTSCLICVTKPIITLPRGTLKKNQMAEWCFLKMLLLFLLCNGWEHYVPYRCL